MRIGIVGCGVVGSALQFGFQKLGHQVFVHDIKLDTKIDDLMGADIIFICVPTPMKEDGSCDSSIVEKVFSEIWTRKTFVSEPIICIKSTVSPGTTDKLMNLCYDSNNKFVSREYNGICFCPEFLRERCATTDFVENQKLLAIGTYDKKAYTKVSEAHSHYPQKTVLLTPKEAELLKYYHNTINAARVALAGEFYDICEKLDTEFQPVDYSKIKNALLHSTSLPDQYLDVNKNMRGFSSICFSKDIPAICKLGKDLGLDLPLLYNIEISNDRHEKTPFGNTRP